MLLADRNTMSNLARAQRLLRVNQLTFPAVAQQPLVKLRLALDQVRRQFTFGHSDLRVLLVTLSVLSQDVPPKLLKVVHNLLTVVGWVETKFVTNLVVAVNQLQRFDRERKLGSESFTITKQHYIVKRHHLSGGQRLQYTL